MSLILSCDFDGTLTLNDTVDAILEAFAEPEWTEVEAEWAAGRIGSRDCLRRQTALLRVTQQDLTAFIDDIAVDADAAGFFADCGRLGLPVQVVSDGFDWVVRRVLARIGVRHTPIIANHLTAVGEDRWLLQFPHSAPQCGSGVCKCAVVKSARNVVHIGDGRSDACVADVADLVFAKGWLLEQRQQRGLPAIGFENFAEVRAQLADLDALIPTPVLAQRIA